MKKENFFKANLNESELSNFLVNLNESEQERFLEILNDESFNLDDLSEIGEEDASVHNLHVDCWRNSWFFVYYVRAYRDCEIFTPQAMKVIDDCAYRYNLTLYAKYYENYLEDEDKMLPFFKVWDEYADFIRKVNKYITDELEIDVAGYESDDNEDDFTVALEDFKEDIDEYYNSRSLDYFKKISAINFRLNEMRINIVETIIIIEELLCDFVDEYEHKISDLEKAQELIKKANKLIENAQEGAIVNNCVNFKWIYDNDLIDINVTRDLESKTL